MPKCSTCTEAREPQFYVKSVWANGDIRYDNLCKQCRISANRSARQSDRGKLKKRLAAHGIDELQYSLMLQHQNGRCAICQCLPEEPKNDVLFIDHCHKTSKIRGLLCSKCNSAIGYLKDDPLIVESALRYLRRHGEAT